ncbi:MAG TPA: TraR/DksA C4-type zinc finger protein [Bacteriovoracaceae bacterium]|nr:TraR/DksA C4-type zinc finger protein [Bacteriovoracaceae bacterium]
MNTTTKALTNKQLSVLKDKLLAALEECAGVNEDITLAMPEGTDELEQSIADYTNSHNLRFKNRNAILAKKIKKSLKKFDLGEYGLCNECGEWIRFERLLARPMAEECIVCKEESERGENRSHTTSSTFQQNVALFG